jgi:hypothetical protein
MADPAGRAEVKAPPVSLIFKVRSADARGALLHVSAVGNRTLFFSRSLWHLVRS